ncbi:primosomal protein N' [Thermoleophilia bacterium SCSIO 60948]|nr:primosomal protein N' [Thermoleophilia bacterium SCSIO 60948]
MSIARVEPLTRARALRGPFDYLIGERLGGVEVGELLLVPFGPRRIPGVVTELAAESELPRERLAEPIRSLGVATPAELVELAAWMADEYCSTVSRSLELVLPPGSGGSGAGARPRSEKSARITDAGREALVSARLGERQRVALETLAAAPEGHLDPAGLRRAGLSADALRRLEARSLLVLERGQRRMRPTNIAVGSPSRRVEPTPSQAAAHAAIVGRLDAGGGELLVWGVTGSGKTEVYLGAAQAALERGRGAIVLVPEIGLTPQTVTRFEARFGERVAVLGSHLTDAERRDEWERMRTGEARVCVGPRSAVFAPIADLGLIVIDEEHEAAYKQEGDPRYDAREVAARRARNAGAVLVAGSATPRPESWLRMDRVELRERASGRPLPPVEILDMRAERGGPLHPESRRALAELGPDGKAIVLVPRRGWSPHVSCRTCGRAWGCPSCDVSLVLHRATGRMVCHHCNHIEPIPTDCPDCGSRGVAQHGSGSERIEAVIRDLVTPIPVGRLDADAARGRHARILKAFGDARAGVLVGTQMIAKGHDFPDVSLCVVLDADATLRFPDLRAEERTFSLVSQVAGRSGRGGEGRVLVQTLAPDADAIRRAAAHDAPGFLAGELERRRALSYPPYGHLVRIDLSAPDEADVERTAAALASDVSARLPGDAQLLGPAPRFRLRDRHRRQILVKAARRPAAVEAVRGAIEEAAAARRLQGVATAVDVEPV